MAFNIVFNLKIHKIIIEVYLESIFIPTRGIELLLLLLLYERGIVLS